ncbi:MULTISPECIES: hypothetical protein [unclassified Novosphingobium]|uniref:hypothetical protein n=1 Tax=unclassified Novosphingobium TaxID=2644732 RepID=UPI00135BB30D|nr:MULTISPECIES: hypothetical protein [unclassified Novosphingobium]
MTDDALKPRVDFLHTAFLWLAGALVTALVTIVVLNLTLASSANVRTDRLIENISLINRQAGEQGTKMDEANRRLDRIEAKLDRLLDQRQK